MKNLNSNLLNKTSITQTTRQAARQTVRNLKASGRIVLLVDNGKQFKANARWVVEVYTPVIKISSKPRTITRKAKQNNNKGFDLRKVTSGVKGYDVFLDGEFIMRRDTKLTAYEDTLRMAQKAKIDYSTLNYR